MMLMTEAAFLWLSVFLWSFEKLHKQLKSTPTVPLSQSGPDDVGRRPQRAPTLLKHRSSLLSVTPISGCGSGGETRTRGAADWLARASV